MHLLLPLLASLLFVCGLILIQRAAVGTITTLFLCNIASAIVFSGLWLLGGAGQPWAMVWQPMIVGGLYMMGLGFTVSAAQWGDVSIAAPLLGVKVLLVAFLVTVVDQQQLPIEVWYAAFFATMGIALIQWTGRHHPKRIALTVMFALFAATSFATFDVLVQRWADGWGTGRFLPIAFWFVGLLSLSLIPWVQWRHLSDPPTRRYLLPGAILIALQAVCITSALAIFGDAARVNVVYALRGMWGVGLAWIVARRWGGAEAELENSVLLTRVLGAGLLTAAVVFVIMSQ